MTPGQQPLKAGQPFTVQIEIRPDNDDCPCALCVERRKMIDRMMNKALADCWRASAKRRGPS